LTQLGARKMKRPLKKGREAQSALPLSRLYVLPGVCLVVGDFLVCSFPALAQVVVSSG